MRNIKVIYQKILTVTFLIIFFGVGFSHGEESSENGQENIPSQGEQVESTSSEQTTSDLDEGKFSEEEPFISPMFDYREVDNSADSLVLQHRITQEKHAFYEVMILAVMAVISLTIVLAFMKCSGTCQPRDMVTTAGLILIIFSTIILVLVASSEEQITAAIGVLGAIAGYLFGTSAATRRLDAKDAPSNKTDANTKSEAQHPPS